MKKNLLIILALVISLKISAQGIEFFEGTWEEVKIEAQKQNKKIFIDFYTKWCAPCRSIAKKVFPIPAVGEVYNSRFVNFKVDAEVGEGIMLAKKYNVNSYPTFVYAEEDGTAIWNGSIMGYGSESGLIELADIAIGKKVKSWEEYQEEYKAGNRSTEFLKKYISARFKATKKLTNDSLKLQLLKSYPQEEWFTESNRNLIFKNAKPGNEFYELLVTNKDQFPQLADRHKMVHYIYMVCAVTKWNENASLEKVTQRLSKDFPEDYPQAKLYMDIDQLRFENNEDEYLTKIFKYIEEYGEPLHVAMGISGAALKAENITQKLASKCLSFFTAPNDQQPAFTSLCSYAYLLYKSGDEEGAQTLAVKYKDLTDQFATSGKLKWYYDTMRAIEKRIEPQAKK